jgi:cytochrome P450
VRQASELPGSRVPALLNGVGYGLNPIGYPLWFARRFGKITRSRFPGLGLIVNVAEPDLVRQVFTGDPAVFHGGDAGQPILEPAVGTNSVLTLDEAPHMRQRKLLLEPFHGERVRRWEHTIRRRHRA